MDTQKIWSRFNNQLYFFILKKVKDKDAANDIFQNTFFKIHKNLDQIQDQEKIKGWVYQIARNEIFNYFNKETKFVELTKFKNKPDISENQQSFCCFDKFISHLPKKYNEVIELVYLNGYKQKEVSKMLGISLANVKARVRRAKEILKTKFNVCCKYEFDTKGNLVGESNCTICVNS